VPARLEGDRLVLDGNVNADTVPALAEAGDAFVSRGFAVVDFGGVDHVDSSAIALSLEWLRGARAAGRTLTFVHLPPAMVNLARLYDVSELLSPAAH